MVRTLELAGALGLVGFAIGCSGPSPGSETRPDTVMIFAAASTTDVVQALSETFERAGVIEVESNFAASSALALQILNGAGADLFLSANAEWVDALEDEGLVARRVELLRNRLVVIGPRDSGLRLRTIVELTDAGIERLALADPAAVPAGIHAKRTLERFGLWSKIESRVVAGPDVRHALAYVASGAAEAGIVYATDAAISERVEVVLDLPPSDEDPIVYTLALLTTAANDPAARSIYDEFQSVETASTFERHGFLPRTDAVSARRATER